MGSGQGIGKLQLAADAAAQAGPSGAGAAGFSDPNLAILSYSESKGLSREPRW